MLESLLENSLSRQVAEALAEDIREGDITAQLIPESTRASGRVISRENAVICGQRWVDEVFRQVDPSIKVDWLVNDGQKVEPNTILFRFSGPARGLLTAERSALNFLQTLSGTATIARSYADRVAHTSVKLLDTRKTLPLLRLAQKYAVTCGGCHNHRLGLWDAFLIKENHIMACGSISAAVAQAGQIAPGKPVEVEVERLDQLKEALQAGADIVMLDNFSHEQLREAVALTAGRARLEASGNIDDQTLVAVAETGVDYISIGALTKHCQAIDLSMRLDSEAE